ncbi:hypothetical protein LSTR_LSTR003200 [Laodelphax striatellus]|uniref:Uncharacterized protein n=1 Tax=Laodelphax striatellus TaxID=195883 RepID=A0A482XTP4_LAOST|nr:hypothetical protein LSTR_LSTR003200 [Laodelphax striatellus]
MRKICVFVLLVFVKSLASENFNTDTRLVYLYNILLFSNGGWLEMVDLLKEVNEQKMADLMRDHKELFIDNTRLAHRLLTSVIRHSMCRLLDDQFQKPAFDIIEKATKLKLSNFLNRLSSYDTTTCKEAQLYPVSTIAIDPFLTPQVLQSIKADGHLSSTVDELEDEKYSYLRDIVDDIIANKELEFIDLATSDSRISSFLIEVFSIISEGGQSRIAEKIVDIKTNQVEPGNSKALEKADYGVLQPLFKNINVFRIISMYAEYFKNTETSIFLQFMVVRHCKLHHLNKKLGKGALDVLGKAQELKLKDVKVKIEKIIAGTALPSSGSLAGSIPESGIDLQNDEMFSSLRNDKSFLKLGNDQISRIEDALSMWIDEKVQLAIVKPDFDYFFKEIFAIINSGKANKEVEKLVKKVEFIPTFIARSTYIEI